MISSIQTAPNVSRPPSRPSVAANSQTSTHLMVDTISSSPPARTKTSHSEYTKEMLEQTIEMAIGIKYIYVSIV